MEITITRKEIPIWVPEDSGVKKTTFAAEAVVPDTIDDVKNIVFCRAWLLLKGKEPGKHGTKAEGEACAALLLLTETGKLETFRLSKPFDLDFEAPNPDADAIPRIVWSLVGAEARLLNPRKIGLSFEVSAELRSFRRGSVPTSVCLEGEEACGLHLLREEREALVMTAAGEKPFTLRQQFDLDGSEPAPAAITGEEQRFRILGIEQVGSRCIVKGELLLRIFGLDARGMPAESSFRLPFSQLIDADDRPMEASDLSVLPSSVYLDLSEGPEGGRSLDAEVHAVLQYSLYTRCRLTAAADAYSTRMPVTLSTTALPFLSALERGSGVLRAEERLPMSNDVAEILASQAVLGPLETNRERSAVPVNLELLVRSRSGELSALRRSFRLCGDSLPEPARAWEPRLNKLTLTLQDAALDCSCEAAVDWELRREDSLRQVLSLTTDEENAWDPGLIPTLTLVRRGGESLWELAKSHHSSVELISGCNEAEAEFLLIPAE